MFQSPLSPLHITTGTFIRAALVVVLFVLLYTLLDMVLVLLTAVVIASALEPGARFLIRMGVARLIAVIGIYLALAFAFIGVFYFFVPSLLSDAAQFLRAVPEVIDIVPPELSRSPESAPESNASFAQALPNKLGSGLEIDGFVRPSSLTAVFTDLSQILGSFAFGFWDNVSVLFGGIVSFILIVVLSFYLAVQEDGVEKFLRVVTPQSHEAYIVSLWRRSQKKIGYWMQGQILLAVLVGMLVYLGLTVLGLKNALFLAVLAAMLETIPLFGPILSAIPAVFLGYTTSGLTLALLLVGLYLIIQQFENHLIYPLVVKKIVGVPPMLVILALIIGAKLAGFLGIILSVPVAATLMEYLEDLQQRKAAANT
ncbi:MAG: hypothetical protein Greene041679_439 [Parcubacteria group bacterium Greene0416_79]|nr:MAG: hypothetical protein Greene041679_439 [Parcubacteria group bacterium Greene0416_79]